MRYLLKRNKPVSDTIIIYVRKRGFDGNRHCIGYSKASLQYLQTEIDRIYKKENRKLYVSPKLNDSDTEYQQMVDNKLSEGLI